MPALAALLQVAGFVFGEGFGNAADDNGAANPASGLDENTVVTAQQAALETVWAWVRRTHKNPDSVERCSELNACDKRPGAPSCASAA